jgi:NTP pyrophosphatase (non-canonical NTP hydrolase)
MGNTIKETKEEGFVIRWQEMAEWCHATSVEHGFWEHNDDVVDHLDPDNRDVVATYLVTAVPEKLALIHAEVSEALEAVRAGNPPDDKVPEYSGLEAELADVVIRIMDLEQKLDLNVGGAIVAKNKMNEGREHMHGGKKF